LPEVKQPPKTVMLTLPVFPISSYDWTASQSFTLEAEPPDGCQTFFPARGSGVSQPTGFLTHLLHTKLTFEKKLTVLV